MFKALLSLLIASALISSAASAQNVFNPLGRQVPIPDPRIEAPHASAQRLDYGPRYWQKTQFFEVENANSSPILVVLANRGRRTPGYSSLEWLRYRALQAGYAVAMVPYWDDDDEPEQMAENYSSALAYLNENADELGINMQRIVLFGYSSPHFAVLMGTNPEIFDEAQVPFSSLRGVATFGGTTFDLAHRMTESSFLQRRYSRIFGDSPEEIETYSPSAHLGSPNAPQFLFLTSIENDEAIEHTDHFLGIMEAEGLEGRSQILPEPRTRRLATYLFVEEDGAGSDIWPFLRSSLEVEEEPP